MRWHWRRIAGVWVFLCVGAVASAAENVADQARLAAEDLLHSAKNLYHAPSAVARAGRLVAISQYLASLAPDAPSTQRLQADVYQSKGDLVAAAKAARALLDATPTNFSAGLRWLRFQLSTYDRAGARAQFLKSVLDQPTFPKPLRSVAATELARIFVGQGTQSDAVEVLKQALSLDPLNHTAVISLLELTENPTAMDRVKAMLALLRGNPRAYWVTRELAGQLCDLGLHTLALQYYRHTWALWQGKRPVSDAPVDFACEYLSALLDANKPNVAVELFGPAVDRLKASSDFASLMIEAYRKAGQDLQADPLRKDVEERYQKELLSHRVAEGRKKPGVDTKTPATQASSTTAQVAMNLAWYYLLVENRPRQALESLSEAKSLGAKGEAVDLITGAAELTVGQAKGLKLLEPLVEKYPLAAAYAARFELASGQAEKGVNTLLTGVKQGRRNLAYRMLSALARKYKIALPPAEQAQAVEQLIQGLDPRVLAMGLHPETFIRITVRPMRESVPLCEPIRMEATLENIGDVPVSVGSWGLLEHRLGLELRVGGKAGSSFSTMPMVIWPAPRYLGPRQKVTATTRLDTGPMARWLANHPLWPIELQVQPIVSPREVYPPGAKSPQVVSGLEPMKLSPVTVRQTGLLSATNSSSEEQYNQALATLRKTLVEGEIPARMLTARRIAAVLAWIRDIENGRASVPQTVRPVLNEKYLLGLMGLALRDKADVVRAEMVTALEYADMGSVLLNEVGLVVQDPSPLVRFRVAELIGASGTKGNRKLIELYAKDPDKRVRTMARAFLHTWQKTKKRAATTKPATAPAKKSAK